MSISVGNAEGGQVVHNSSTVKKINNFFSSSKTRFDGWQLLDSYLPYCSDEDFLQFCVSWMHNCCKIDGFVKHKNFAINLLSNLFKISSKYQELKKSVSFFITTQYFDFFFKYFLNSLDGWNCTKNCLLYYRAACGAYKDALQKHLTNEIDKNMKISVSTAECFALLPCTGGGGNDGENYKRNWKSQSLKIVNICHSILNDLYTDAEELKLQEYETLEHTYNKTEEQNTPEYLTIQLCNYTTILNCMLLNEYPAPKCIPSDLIFQLICRGLAISPKTLKNRQTTEFMALQEVLPQIHIIFFSLLKSVVVTCKNQLLPYSHLICKLIKQTLEWTEVDSGYCKTFAKLRISVYETLCNWLTAARNGSCIETVSNVVISSALNDIVVKKEVVFLKGKHQKKNKEPKFRRVDATSKKLCFAAVKCLQFILKFAGVSLKPEEQKALQEVVLELLLEIQKSSTVDPAASFTAPECRRELYSLLVELVHQPCAKWPPPLHFALRLFSNGVNDSAPEISSLCLSALNFTTIIIHPQYDNGGFITREAADDEFIAENEMLTEEIEFEDEKGDGEIVENNENSSESIKTDPAEKNSDINEERDNSSDEDSTVTITYVKEVETCKENLQVEEKVEAFMRDIAEEREPEETNTNVETVQNVQNEEERPVKRQKVEETPKDKTPSPLKAEVTEPPQSVTKGKSSERHEESPSLEEIHPKKRYFLRSKTKGSSEEPEEGQKSGSSPESLKGTPNKSQLRSTPLIKSSSRPKTRALSRMETNAEQETKSNERNGHDEDVDEEILKAAFDDSLID